MYSSVLIALDKEDEAGALLMASRVQSLLSDGAVDLHLVYVRTPLPQSYLAKLPQHLEANDRRDAEAWLREYSQQHGFSDQLAGAHAPVGTISREVVKLAEVLNIDAIFATAHRLDFGRILFGTNTHAIVRDAPCDVVVVRERKE